MTFLIEHVEILYGRQAKEKSPMKHLYKLFQIQINGSRLKGSILFPYGSVEGKS